MDLLTLLIVLVAVVLVAAVFAGRIDPFAALVGVIILIAVLYAVPRLR